MTQPNDDLRATQPGKRRVWRYAAMGVAAILLLAALVVGFAAISLNPGRYAPALIAATERATGRQVSLGGPVTINWSLTPALQVTNVALANPPGFADPDMLTLGALRAEIKLLPLLSHRVDILRLELISPRLTLQRLPAGTANWDFSGAPGAGHAPGEYHSKYKIALERVEVEDGLLTVKAANGAILGLVHFGALTGTADSLYSPLHVTAQAQIGTTPFGISGVMGPIARFSGVGTGPWPLDLDFTLAGATLNITGTVAHPRDARGYNLAVNMSIPALGVFGQALPPALTDGRALPPIQNITATAQISDDHAPLPAVTALSVKAGPSDLSTLRPGLALTSFDLEMASLDQPFSVAASGQSDSGAFSLNGNFGALASLLPAAWLPANTPSFGALPVSVTAQLGAASASMTGAISTPQTLSGVALAVSTNIPDLSALSAIIGTPLPAWKQIAAQTTLIDPGGEGLYQAAGLDGLTVTMDNAAFGGGASLYFGGAQKLQLALSIAQANLDALLAAFPTQTATEVAAPAPVTPVAPTASTLPVFALPNTPLPAAVLTSGNADIQLSANSIVWRGATYTALQAHALVANNVLTINPFTGELPGGDFTASATLDTSKTPAAETLAIKAPALALAPLFQAFGLGNTAEGNFQLQLNASSTGNDVQDIAAHINGQLGLASVNDVVDTALIDRAFGPVEMAAGLKLPAASGMTPIRCFALAVAARNGVAAVNTAALDSSRLVLQGSGSVDLSQGAYKLSLLPVGGNQLLLGGSFAQPLLAAVGPPPPAPPAQTQAPDDCPAALAAARFGQPGPPAPPQATLTPVQTSTPPNAPKNLLNSLLTP